MSLTIKTNHVPRATLSAWELTEKELAEFDYLSQEQKEERGFVRFKGQVYDLGEFMAVTPQMLPEFQSWHAYSSDSAWSGIVIHMSDDQETVVIGQYFS